MKSEAIKYTSTILNAWNVNPSCKEFYAGAKGAKRFAREFGYGLNDFNLTGKELNDVIQSSYSSLCVRAYNLNPPIDAKVWFNEIRSQIKI